MQIAELPEIIKLSSQMLDILRGNEIKNIALLQDKIEFLRDLTVKAEHLQDVTL
jgi:hypothetical protein